MSLDDAYGDLGVEVLAGEDVEVGVTARVTEVAGYRGGLDELHQRLAGGLKQVRREVREDGPP